MPIHHHDNKHDDTEKSFFFPDDEIKRIEKFIRHKGMEMLLCRTHVSLI